MPDLGAILTAMVTPFDARGRVDEEATVALANHLIDHGSDGVVVAGTSGEASTLTDEEQVDLVRLVASELKGRASVVAGAGSNDTRHAVELTELVTEAGADAVLAVTGYYNRPNRRGIVRHYTEVGRATHLPVLVYNIPSRTTIDLDNDLLAELGQLDGIEGLKQARATDLRLIDGLDHFYAGNDDMLADVLDLGGSGGILVASQIVGDEMRRMVDEPEERRSIHDALLDVFEALSVTTNPIPIKAALNLLGHRVGALRLPLVEADESELAVIRAMLERHGMLQRAGSA